MVQNNEYVDLGLPSGLKWAKCNLGANKETEYGDYYMFGSTTPDTNRVCDWAHAPFNNCQEDYDNAYFRAHKDEWFNGDGTLKSQFDAATIKMGTGWRMPTQSDLQELIDGTTSQWIENYYGSGVNGRLFTSKTNDNTLFIPASGIRYDLDTYFIGEYGYVWNSSFNSDYLGYAWFLFFGSHDIGIYDTRRFYSQSIRGVYDKEKDDSNSKQTYGAEIRNALTPLLNMAMLAKDGEYQLLEEFTDNVISHIDYLTELSHDDIFEDNICDLKLREKYFGKDC